MRKQHRIHGSERAVHCLIPLLAAVLFMASSCSLNSGGGIEIAGNGASRYRIVLASDASPSELNAAMELKRFIYEISGAELPVVSDESRPGRHEIILGDNRHFRALDTGIDIASLGEEGYVLRTVGSSLIIAGGDVRGVLYGVYGLLEDHLGCRWFTPGVSRIPECEHLEIPVLDERVVPAVSYREPYVWEAFDGNWAARNRMNRNSAGGGLGVRHGGRIEWVPGFFAHTFEDFIPPDRYFRRHPEYFSLVNGRRKKWRSQLCCTNEDVAEIIAEGAIEAFREYPWANVLSVSHNDWDYHCECDSCTALAEREGSDMAPVLLLVNRVAEAVEREFPDKIISTLAYQWTRKPPKTMRPRRNVAIRLCTIECCFSHPLNSCDSDENRAFAEDLRAWSTAAGRLWVWNYVTSFAHYFVPFPNLRTRDDDIRFFVENGVDAIFQQDVYTTPCGELSGLSAYMNAKLLWNPDYSENTIIDDYLSGVYGPAAPHIRAYIDLIHDKVERENIHMNIWQGPDAEYLSDDILAAADSLWNDAERAVSGDRDILERVQTGRLSVDYAIINRDRLRGGAWVVDQDALRLEVNPAFTERLDRFCRHATRAGIVRLKEYGYTVDEFRRDMEKAVRPKRLAYQRGSWNNGSSGVSYRFFEGEWKKMPNLYSLTPMKRGTLPQFIIPGEAEGEVYGYLMNAQVTVPETGVYGFSARSDGYAEVTVGKEKVARTPGIDPLRERTGYTALHKGTHPVSVLFFTKEGGDRLKVFISGPGMEKREVAGELLGE